MVKYGFSLLTRHYNVRVTSYYVIVRSNSTYDKYRLFCVDKYRIFCVCDYSVFGDPGNLKAKSK